MSAGPREDGRQGAPRLLLLLAGVPFLLAGMLLGVGLLQRGEPRDDAPQEAQEGALPPRPTAPAPEPLDRALTLVYSRGDHDGALRLLTPEVLEAEGHVAVSLRAHCLREVGRFSEALEALPRARALDPACPCTFQIEGDIIAYDEPERSQALYDQAEGLGADRPDDEHYQSLQRSLLFNNRALGRERAGEEEAAREDFDRAVGLNPGDPQLLFNRACLLRKLGSPGQALADLDEVLASGAGIRGVHLERGMAYGDLKRWEEAAADFERALEEDPYLPQAESLRGIIEAHLGRPSRH